MKQKRFFRAIVAIAMMLICSLPSLAYDFEIDGIYYNITSSSEPYTVEVTFKDESLDSYSGTILIPESVTYNEKKYLVTKIGDNTFFQCGENLTRLEIPNSIIEIGNWAFCDCQARMRLIIPESVTTIGDWAFYHCQTEIGSIPESVTTIGESAFSYSSLALTQIPNSIISIGNNAFEGCVTVMNLLIKLPASLQSLGENVFIGPEYSPNESELCISEAITPPTITTTSLPSTIKTLIVPSGSKSVYESADVWSDLIADNNITVIEKGFLSITVENTTAGQLNRAVRTASGAKAAMVTDMVVTGTINATDIEYMRQSMTSLLNLDLSGADCVEFPDGAFANKITLQSINLPNNLNSVNNTLFTRCIALSSLSLNTETIGKGTFRDLPSLSDVDLGENVKTVEEYAFNGCVSLKEITIPDATLSLGKSAFGGCQSLKSVTLGNALTSIGQWAFLNCRSLAQLSIPETVVSIGDYAFYNCFNLSDINIPENIETIGTYTFEKCISLSEIELPESIETIPAGMFENCSSLSSVDIPIGVTEIGENAFSGCEKLTILDLSENTSLLSIGGNAFYGCSSIEIINFPTTLESIGRNAFSGCTALSLMSIPSVTPPSLPTGTKTKRTM